MNDDTDNFELNEAGDDFRAYQNASARSSPPLQKLASQFSREVSRHHLNYEQLKVVFRMIRDICEIEVPRVKEKLIDLPTKEELDRFYKATESPTIRLLWAVLQETGLRISELASLEVKHIDFHTNQIFVEEAKGGKQRNVVFGNKLKERLLLYLDGHKSNRWLFENSRHRKYSVRRLEEIFAEIKALAGIEKKFTPHSMRHLCFRNFAAKNLSEDKRAILAGHSLKGGRSAVQQLYSTLSLCDVKEEAIAILDDLS